MLSALPQPEDSILANPSANVVTFSIIVEQERELRPADGIAWQKALTAAGYKTGSLQKVLQRSVSVQTLLAQGAPKLNIGPTVDSRDGWLTAASASASQAAIYANGVILERSAYSGFADFRKEIYSVCTALNEILHPSIRTRLGLRYSNALSSKDAANAGFWRDKVEPAFLSIGLDDRLSEDFQRSFSVVDFNAAEIALQVRSGLQPDAIYENAIAFVFDIDLSSLKLSPFSVEECLTDVDLLNRYARQMFQAIITPAHYAVMKEAPNA